MQQSSLQLSLPEHLIASSAIIRKKLLSSQKYWQGLLKYRGSSSVEPFPPLLLLFHVEKSTDEDRATNSCHTQHQEEYLLPHGEGGGFWVIGVVAGRLEEGG